MIMRIRWFLVGSVFSLGILAGVFVAFGQTDSVVDSFQPFVVDVQQFVPIQVSIPLSNTDAPTLTVPLTVGISLRVNIEGPSQAIVEPLSTVPAEVAIATTTPMPTAKNEPIFDNMVWTVESTENLGSTADINIFTYETSGKFIKVNFLLENVGKTPLGYNNLIGFQVTLVDDQERLFSPYPISYQIDDDCADARMNPGLSASCFILFEVAKDADNLKLRLTQGPLAEPDQHVVEFDLGLD